MVFRRRSGDSSGSKSPASTKVGDVDLLVNNAGISSTPPAENISAQEFRDSWRIISKPD
jgi:NAD(P)-dependent dehydrogenase (short-subunit alcohol dehydrogenase family)